MNGSTTHPMVNGVKKDEADDNGVTLEELGSLHEDILDQNVDAVHDIIQDFQEEDGPILELIEKELVLEPLPEDHPLNGLPQGALHRAVLVGSAPIFSQLAAAHPKININGGMLVNGYTPLHVAVAAQVTTMASYLAANGADVNATAKGGCTPMHLAAKSGYTDIAKILVVKGAVVESRDERGRTPLHVAAYEGQTKMVAFLLKREVDISARDNEGMTPLHLSQVRGGAGCTELLLSNGGDVEAVDNDGNTPLFTALKNFSTGPGAQLNESSHPVKRDDTFSHQQTIQLLLGNGNVNPNHQNNRGETPFHYCGLYADEEMANMIFDYGGNIASLSNDGQTPLHYARSKAVMDYFIQIGANVHAISRNGDSALHVYSQNDDVTTNMVEELINRGVDINALNSRKECALYCACVAGNTSKVRLLCEKGARLDFLTVENMSVAQGALSRKHYQVVDELFKHRHSKLDINNQDIQGRCLLHLAVEQDNLQLVQYLVKSGANVNLLDVQRQNPASLAARARNYNILKFLLEHGARLDTQNSSQSGLPLHTFAQDGCSDIVQILINQGHQIDSLNKDQQTVLHVALDAQKWETSICLLRNRAKSNLSDSNGNSPLHIAVEKSRDVNLIEMVLGNGANVNAVNRLGKTALHLAVQYNTLEVVMLLVESGANVNLVDNDGNTALHVGLTCALNTSNNNNEDFVETIQFLLDGGFDLDVNVINKNGQRPVHFVAQLGNKSLLVQLLKAKASANVQCNSGVTPLMLACEFDHPDIATQLLQMKVSVDLQDMSGETAIFKATKSGSYEIVDLLLQHGANGNLPRNDGRNCLHQCLSDRNYEVMELLLSNEVEINVQDKKGVSPLHIASSMAPHDIIRNLIGQGSKVNLADSNQRTALHYAISNHDISVIKVLVSKNANVDASDNVGNTALHIAAESSSYEHVDALLQEHADVDAVNVENETALHIAAKHKETDVLELLVANESDINSQDKKGLTPLLAALESNNLDGAAILLDYDADVRIVDGNGDSALHKVFMHRDIRTSLLQSLTRKGLSCNVRNRAGKSAIDLLTQLKREDESLLLHAMGIE